MSENSKIEWTNSTWNPVLGCDKVSPGCANCYAVKTVWRMAHNPMAVIKDANEGLVERQGNGVLNWTGVVRCLPDRLKIPLAWRTPRRIFVNSQSDLFHPDVPEDFIDQVFAVMALCPQHTFQILTKRPERMLAWMQLHDTSGLSNPINGSTQERVEAEAECIALDQGWCHADDAVSIWPLPNVWLGTSVEDQKTANERILHLLRVPAAVRFLSCEPLLEHVTIPQFALPKRCLCCNGTPSEICSCQKIDWVIVGGESGSGARPMHPDWARSLRDQCVEAGVPYFYKQWGEWVPLDQSKECEAAREAGHNPGFCPIGRNGEPLACATDESGGVTMYRFGKKAAGRLLDGRTWDEMPQVAR